MKKKYLIVAVLLLLSGTSNLAPARAQSCRLYAGRFGYELLAEIDNGVVYRDRREAIAHIYDDKVYKGHYGYDAIFHIDDNVFHKGAYGYDPFARLDDGVLYRGRWGYDAMAHFDDGVIYRGRWGFDALGHGESCGNRELAILTLLLGLAPADEMLREAAAGVSVIKGMAGTRYMELEIDRGGPQPYIRELSDRAWREVALAVKDRAIVGYVGGVETSLDKGVAPDGSTRLEGHTQGRDYAALVKPGKGGLSGRAWIKASGRELAPIQLNLEYDERGIRSSAGSTMDVSLVYEKRHTSLEGYSFLSGRLGRERIDLLLYRISVPDILEHLYLILDLETPVELRSTTQTPL
ncbi:MAG: hypothetical protein HY921_04760 [Elusimicrobia bacterium]|nr:hypothetical protein [Elusimicrobiota bacterium]